MAREIEELDKDDWGFRFVIRDFFSKNDSIGKLR